MAKTKSFNRYHRLIILSATLSASNACLYYCKPMQLNKFFYMICQYYRDLRTYHIL